MPPSSVHVVLWWLLRVAISVGVVGTVRKLRAYFDYLDFVSACQLNMDPGVVGNVQSAIVLEDCVPFSTVVERFRSVFFGPTGDPVIQRYRRLCSVAQTSAWRWPYWSTPARVPPLDEEYHFKDHGAVDSFAQVEAFVTASLSEGLDIKRPLWQLHYWNSVGAPDGRKRSVFVLKVHHCVADGFSTLRTVLTACQRQDGHKISDGNPRSSPAAASIVAKGTDHAKEREAALAKAKPVSLPAAVAKMLLLPQDPVGVLKSATHLQPDSPRVGAANWPGAKSGDLATVNEQAVSVEWLKEIGRATPMKATVNDLLLTALAGALRRHAIGKQFAQSGGATSATPAQAVMWVSLAPFRDLFKPHTELPLTWGNGGLGAVYLSLPLDITEAGPRLQEICNRVRKLTRSPEPVLGNVLIGLFGALPKFISRPICEYFVVIAVHDYEPTLDFSLVYPCYVTSRASDELVACLSSLGNAIAYKTTVSMSNIPGPQFPLAFLQCPVERMFFFVSPQGTVGHFVTIFTFDGKISVSISSDSALLNQEEARAITGKLFLEELQELRQLYVDAQKTD